MISGSVARRYAKALLSIGVEKGNLEALAADLERFNKVVLGSDELVAALSDPSVGTANQKAILVKVLDKLSLNPMVRNVILLLNDRGRVAIAGDVLAHFRQMCDEQAGVMRATVRTPAKLDDAQLVELKNAVEGRVGQKVELTEVIDEALVAGVITEVGSTIFDGSVQTRIEQMKQHLLER